MRDLAADVQAYLEAEGLVDGTTDWPSTRGALYDEGADGQVDQIVQIAEDVGPAPEVHAAEGAGSEALTFPSVLVTVRGLPFDRDSARAKAAAIYEALHSLSGVTLGNGTYMQVRARSSEFARVFDKRSRPRFSMSYLATAAAVA
jgi:hypothetical protein